MPKLYVTYYEGLKYAIYADTKRRARQLAAQHFKVAAKLIDIPDTGAK